MNRRTHEGYCDGALFYNNPAKVAHNESKLIWRDVEDCHPDILLSIGTGHNGQATTGVVESRKRLHRAMPRQVDDNVPLDTQRRHGFRWWMRNVAVAQWFQVLVSRVDSILNAEQLWNEFRTWANDPQGREGHRYVRINPNLGFKPPRLDEKDEIEKLSRVVNEKLRRGEGYPAKIRRVAHRLVASCFYFERKEVTPQEEGYYLCKGI
ncbi:MAG: hypothetical protein INR71_08590 [Terriglobus roseus]|nr:hypothetical protein [Terriglobus roseus]